MKYNGYNKGLAALTTTVIVLVVLVILIASYGLITSSAARQFSNVYQSAKSFYVSEAGIEDGLARYLRSGGTVTGSWTLASLSSGTTDVAINVSTQATLTSAGDVGTRQRSIQVTINQNPIYTYAGIIGDGGLWMSDRTDIKCVSGSGCKGVDEAGDAGTIWVNGPIWANGTDASGKYGSGSGDARIVGHAYTIGKVDIRPSEKKEPSPNTAEHKFVCLGVGITDSACTIKATAIAQKVRIHEGDNITKRFGFRIAYHGNAHQLPGTKAYPVRQSGSVWEFPQRIKLDADIGTTAQDERLFAKFKIDTNHDGVGETLPADTPDWVYFSVPSGGLAEVDDDESVYIVLQAESSGGDANSYYKIYYDDSSAPGYIHTGGQGQYITSGTFCPPSGASDDCYSTLTSASTPKLQDDQGNDRADFHFRLYSLGSEDDDYEHSLQVFGELHADEAIGATVVGEGSSASNKDIAFVGRRFASAFWKDRNANHMIWGYSFVQQLDNCDLGGAGTETVGDDLETRRGYRTFCDSQVRNVQDPSSLKYGGSNQRRFSNGAAYPVLTGFYCNPYKNANNVEYGGNQNSCVQDTNGASGLDPNGRTPYQFNALANSSGRGCYVACGSGLNSSCGAQDIFKTHYVYPSPDAGAYGEHPYNFCKYAGGTLDEGYASEAAFKSMLASVYGIAADVQDLYLPKAPPPKGPWPISDTKINGWVSSLFTNTALTDGSAGDDTIGDNAYTIRSSRSWPPAGQSTAPVKITGNLVIRNGAKLTLNKGAHIYVTGNLHLVDDPNKLGGTIEMNNSSGASGWDANNVGLVIVDGFVDTESDTQLLGGSKSQDEYMLVISRSTNMGEFDPYDWAAGGVPAATEYDKAAIYALSHQDDGATVSYYAPYGSVVLEKDSSRPNAMQIAARKLVMRRDTEISYDYGVLDMVFPGGPASATGISDYDEIAP